MASAERIADRLREAADRIEQLAGSRPCRAVPAARRLAQRRDVQALDLLGYRLAGWSWGLWDWNWWRPREGAALADRLARRANDGDIVVIHDGHHIDPQSDRRYAIEATARPRAGAAGARPGRASTSLLITLLTYDARFR